jgi:peptidoglycan/LPS O-acetylase OafA/YrhL
MKQKLHFENLDSLRFFAAIAVVLFHCSNWFKLNNSTTSQLIKKIISFNGLGGNYGVVFFFILSGFLITYLLFIENEKKGIHLLKFYLRRFFRIWPLYYFTIFIGFLVFPFVLFCLNYPYS